MDVCTDPTDVGAAGDTPVGEAPVRATVDGVSWDTSVWRDTKSDMTLLAIPVRIRGQKGGGDSVIVELTFDPEDE